MKLSTRLRAKCWRRGFLAWKLDSNQLRAYVAIRRRMTKKFARYVLLWARRTGKTHLLLVIAIELCLMKKRARVNVAASTKESLKGFLWPILELIFADCPSDLRPHMSEQGGRVKFRNGSVIVLGSCDTKRTVERLRGPASDLNIIEEAGTIPDRPGLRYILTGILGAQTLTTGGATLMALTPPKNPSHASVEHVLNARKSGTCDECTLYDNPRVDAVTAEEYLREDAESLGMTVEEYRKSDDYRREWLAQLVTDPEFAAFPSFTEEVEAELVRPLDSVPLFADRYGCADRGWDPDMTGDLFAMWDHERQVLVVQHELLGRRIGIGDLRRLHGEAEKRLWGAAKVYRRFIDGTPELVHELLQAEKGRNGELDVPGLLFEQTAKDDRDAALALVNRWIRQRKIQIVPYDAQTGMGCRHLQQQIRFATHNKTRTDFERTDAHGHFDLAAALVYLVRNVNELAPARLPKDWGYVPGRDFRKPVSTSASPSLAALMRRGGAR